MGLFTSVKKMIKRATKYDRFGYKDREAYLRDMADIHDIPYKRLCMSIAHIDPDRHCTFEFHQELERIAAEYRGGGVTLDDISRQLAKTQ